MKQNLKPNRFSINEEEQKTNSLFLKENRNKANEKLSRNLIGSINKNRNSK